MKPLDIPTLLVFILFTHRRRRVHSPKQHVISLSLADVTGHGMPPMTTDVSFTSLVHPVQPIVTLLHEVEVEPSVGVIDFIMGVWAVEYSNGQLLLRQLDTMSLTVTTT